MTLIARLLILILVLGVVDRISAETPSTNGGEVVATKTVAPEAKGNDAASACAEANLKGFELLMTYTTFHIGIYISLVAAMIGAGFLKDSPIDAGRLRLSAAGFVVAGLCGGIIACNIPEKASTGNFGSFWISWIGPWDWRVPSLPTFTWATIEHLAFWIGVLPLAYAFLVGGREHLAKPIFDKGRKKQSKGKK